MKHLVAIVDANLQHRNEVVEALLSFYVVHSYDTASAAISGMQIAPPKLILVGQRVGADNGVNFIKDLRREKGLSSVPVIFIIDSEDFRIVDQMRDLGIKDYLAKPYRRSALINIISWQLNNRVERSWQDLPLTQRKALEGTLSVFNSVADDIANGNPLSMQDVNDSCSALVEVVGKEELSPLLKKIRDHNNLIYVHSLRFASMMALFAKAIGLPREQQILVASGGMLHDIGMMTISRDLLNKNGKLSNGEMTTIRGHVAMGQKILLATKSIPKGVQMIVTQHHERLDGAGYPLGLKAEDLNELARMAGIIDVFCALTDRRPYRRTVAPHVALETMATEMKGQLDLDLLIKFKEILLDTTDGVDNMADAT
jgi:putative nucleotidyltransferase with HDIG domain